MRDTHEKFSLATVGLHWIIAIAMIAMLVFGLYLEDLPRSPEKGALIGLHKSVGIIILFLALIKTYWRFLNKFPKPISQLPKWQEKLASSTHWILSIGIVLLPVSGIMMSVGGGYPVGIFGLELIAGTEEKIEILSTIGKTIHGLGGKLLIFFIILHGIGTLKQQLIAKDGTLSRMFGAQIGSRK